MTSDESVEFPPRKVDKKSLFAGSSGNWALVFWCLVFLLLVSRTQQQLTTSALGWVSVARWLRAAL